MEEPAIGRMMPTAMGALPFLGEVVLSHATTGVWFGRIPDGREIRFEGPPPPLGRLLAINTGESGTTGVYRIVGVSATPMSPWLPPHLREPPHPSAPRPWHGAPPRLQPMLRPTAPRQVRAHKPYKPYKPRRARSRPPPMSVDPIDITPSPPGLKAMPVAAQAWCVREWLAGRAQNDIAAELGLTPCVISTALTRFQWRYARRNAVIPPQSNRTKIIRLGLQAFLDQGGKPAPPPMPKDTARALAQRREQAWLLRAEGQTFEAIGKQLGVSGPRAHGLALAFARRMRKAMLHTRWSVEEPDGSRRPVRSEALEIDRAVQRAADALGQTLAKPAERAEWRALIEANASGDKAALAKAGRTIGEIGECIRELRRRFPGAFEDLPFALELAGYGSPLAS